MAQVQTSPSLLPLVVCLDEANKGSCRKWIFFDDICVRPYKMGFPFVKHYTIGFFCVNVCVCFAIFSYKQNKPRLHNYLVHELG